MSETVQIGLNPDVAGTVRIPSTVARRRVAVYLAVGICLTLSYLFIRDSGWRGDEHLHTHMEVVATLLAAMVGVLSLVRHHSGKDSAFLFIGVGFLGTAFLDGYHALVTSQAYAGLQPSDLPSLISWSWVASRQFLSVMLLLSWAIWWRESHLGAARRISDHRIYFGSAMLTMAIFAFFEFAPLPRAYYPDLLFHRPEEFVPAIFFAVALILYLRKGAWRHDAFEHWLVLSLIVGVVGQAVFMSFSNTLFHFEFDAAHVLKKLSYICVFTGLLFNIHASYRDAARDEETARLAKEDAETALAELASHKTALDEHAIVAATDVAGDIIYVNDKFCRISQYSRDELIGRNHRILNSGYHTDIFFIDLWKTIADGRSWHGEIKNKAKDGTHYWVDTTIVPFKNDKRKITQFVAIRTDITERKRSEEALREHQFELNMRVDELEESREQLEEQASELAALSEQLGLERDRAEAATLAKSDFLATMSHEIRTPMNGVTGMTGLLLDTDLNEEQRELAQKVRESADSLLVIINDILDLSKLESGHAETENANFSFEATVDQTVSILSVQAQAKGLKIERRIATDFPPWLLADAARIRQIVFNLLGNAIKFSEHGTVMIDALHRVLDDGEIELRCEISDTGIGIPSDAHEKIFTRFTQADSSVSRKFGGTGLGLPICRQLLEIMGGEIGVSSIVGEGSTFWFTLRCPLGEEPNPDRAEQEDFGGAGTMIPPLKFLVAEDHHINQILISKLLTKAGHRVDIVSNGIEAIEAVQTLVYDIVLMDVQMPEMDGLTATKEIRKMSSPRGDIPIVALTANAMVGHREQYLVAGMNEYVAKPIDRDALFGAIRRVAIAGGLIRETTGEEEAPFAAARGEAGRALPDLEEIAKIVPPGGAASPMDLNKMEDLRRALGEEDLRELMASIPDESSKLFVKIQDSLAAGDLDAARRSAHGLKGLADNFAAVNIAASAREIELNAPTVDAAKGMLSAVEHAIDQTRQWLDKTG